MKKLFLIASLVSVHFAFSKINSSQKMKEKQNLLENNALKTSQPVQDVLEVVNEIQNDESPSESEGRLSLQLMKTKKVEMVKEHEIRQLAQTSEPSLPEPEAVEDIDQENRGEDSDLKSLVHESLFEKLRVRRDLDVFNEDQEDLSLENEGEEIQEDFGNVEVRWKYQQTDQK